MLKDEGEVIIVNHIQVTKDHYDFLNYVNEQRWSSYYEQINECLRVVEGEGEVLYVGIGDCLVPRLINLINPKLFIETVDYDEALNPNYVTSVLEMSDVIDKKKDCIICCQMLEHIPFSDFCNALKEISKCLKSTGYLILSLPDCGRELRFNIHLPKILNVDYRVKLCRKKPFKISESHYWEINGGKSYNKKEINKIINSLFLIEKEYLVNNNNYHRFYICKKKDI